MTQNIGHNTAYAILPEALRDGILTPTAIAGVHVGYDLDQKGYRIYHPSSEKIFVSVQVKFDEPVFPLANSRQTIDSHEFGTSTLKGAPAYPKKWVLPYLLQAPRQVHLKATYRVFQYLYTIRTHRLVFRVGSPLQLTIYSDASRGPAVDIPYATRGYVVQMAGDTVTWSSKRIEIVTLSLTEAVKEAAWLTNLFTWMELSPLGTRLLVGNQPAIHIAHNPSLSQPDQALSN